MELVISLLVRQGANWKFLSVLSIATPSLFASALVVQIIIVVLRLIVISAWIL